MITEDYVSYETAKLLKERWFDVECRDYYSTDGHFYSEDFKSDWNHGGEAIVIFSAPTLQMAMKWLREVHNIHIKAVRYPAKVKNSNNEYCKLWWPEITMLKSLDEADEEFDLWDEYNTYEKACEAAIKYCLTNLI